MPADAPETSATPRGLRVLGAALALLALVVLVSGFVARIRDAHALRARADQQSLPTVVVHPPARADTSGNLELPGRIEAFARAPLYARVSGYLKAWYADIGTPVKAGQLLAEIETPDLDQQLLQARAELANARANVALAETTARRWQALLATDSVSRQEVEEKNADLAAKQSTVNALQANVERYQALKQFARIVAPFDGIVTSRSTDVGSLIDVGSAQGPELFVVSDTRRLRVYVEVPQSYTAGIHRGTTAELRVPEAPGKVYTATVQSTSRAIDAQSGSMLVQLTADNAESALLPGGFARVRFAMPSAANVLAIPSSALIFDKDGLRVATVVDGGKVLMKRVTLARDLGNQIEIASGLEPDDQVIESPPDGITDGDRVQVAVPAGKEDDGGNAAHG